MISNNDIRSQQSDCDDNQLILLSLQMKKGWEELYKQQLEKSWEERIKEYKERGGPKLMKWDPTNPKNKETYEPGARTYDDQDDLDVMVSGNPKYLMRW